MFGFRFFFENNFNLVFFLSEWKLISRYLQTSDALSTHDDSLNQHPQNEKSRYKGMMKLLMVEDAAQEYRIKGTHFMSSMQIEWVSFNDFFLLIGQKNQYSCLSLVLEVDA